MVAKVKLTEGEEPLCIYRIIKNYELLFIGVSKLIMHLVGANIFFL